MKISVIIPAYNEESDIGDCLKSIREQDYEDYEIIVADNHSEDKTVEIAEKYADQIVSVETKGAGPARNRAVEKAKGEVLAFTDADTVVCPNWLGKIAEDFQNPDVVGVGGVLRPKNPRLLDKIMFKINSDWWYRITAVFGFYQLGTPNCAYRRKAFIEEGGFDEELTMLEDTELSLRMKKQGKIIIDKNLWVYNSTRRFKQEGYLKVFLRYLKEYTRLFLRGKVKASHFDEIEH